MFTVKAWQVLIVLCFAALLVAPCAAHPVAQGAMNAVVSGSALTLRVTVSEEEVLVSGRGVRDYGDYLLDHVRVSGDGRPLVGRVASSATPHAARPQYELVYPLAELPRRIELSQNVLREVLFAPGNPWEASYVVTVTADGKPAGDGLLTCHAPLQLDCLPSHPPGRLAMARAFVWHGLIHILTGYDHLLFVGALTLAVRRLVDLVKVVGVFTLAHTLTLSLAVLNLVRLPATVVEPMIAASIVVVALGNLMPWRGSGHVRLVTAFGFGLFHGLGFAGGLSDTMAEMPAISVVAALVAFSMGVELGHQAVVLPLYGLLRAARRFRAETKPRSIPLFVALQSFGSVAISAAGIVYLVAAVRHA